MPTKIDCYTRWVSDNVEIKVSRTQNEVYMIEYAYSNVYLLSL